MRYHSSKPDWRVLRPSTSSLDMVSLLDSFQLLQHKARGECSDLLHRGFYDTRVVVGILKCRAPRLSLCCNEECCRA